MLQLAGYEGEKSDGMVKIMNIKFSLCGLRPGSGLQTVTEPGKHRQTDRIKKACYA